MNVKHFSWDNEKLERERGISFEEVVFHIEQEEVPDILEHSNQQRYGGQKIFVVRIREYAFWVPFVESDTKVFLKTIIPSHKATDSYLRK